MSRFPSFPTLYDECKTISISDVKRWGYLKPDSSMWGELSWSRNGSKTGSIDVFVNTLAEAPYMELNYRCNGTPIKYCVQLISRPANIGKGIVWFFVCLRTGKRCRKLYLADTYFFHRSAFTGCMYEKQTYSHKTRDLAKLFDRDFGVERAYEEIYSRHFRKHYKGKTTKRYAKLLKQIKAGGEISESDFIQMTLQR